MGGSRATIPCEWSCDRFPCRDACQSTDLLESRSSFASYYDPQFEAWGPLRVINEVSTSRIVALASEFSVQLTLSCSQDRVDPGTGFGTHRHQEFEIWSYVVDGELEHRDSMGNLEIMKRGDIQSEFVPSRKGTFMTC
jgi:redox-sensitive bicupin YhaK (pirin superfamily)